MSSLLHPPSTPIDSHPGNGDIELFLQVQGRSETSIVRVAPAITVADLIALAMTLGLLESDAHDILISLSDRDEPLDKHQTLHHHGIRHHHHIHCHRCTRIAVTVRHNGQVKEREFPPAARFNRIHAWSTGKHGFNFSEVDAAEHILQVTATGAQPAPTDHLGSVVTAGCAVGLDLVAKQRIEG
jgi:hypothetical protein